MSERSLNRHQRRKIRTRKQLEQATKQLVLEKGYDAVTIQDIVDRADLGRGTFYLHFQDKEEAVWSLIERGLSENNSLTPQLTAEHSDDINLQAVFANIFRHADQHRDLYTVMLGSKGSAALTNRVQEWFAADFMKEIEFFALTPNHITVPLNILSQFITGALTRLIAWWLNTENDYTAEQMAQLFHQALIHGMDWETPELK